ncbi:hypothetical protein [Frigoribacterium sp. Leaf186]|uniref:hypothetical protein n=1 Tax=Frigoribacterium sp. Leaf186 TaxID=1736293 RepID=UPI0006FDB8E3|nr:hypothetical protein [Frigoribacterium sp. Leaf186]KQS17009.1 hypothetical protein ASG05_05495 [Frigoribacterium sp. Leaf186]
MTDRTPDAEGGAGPRAEGGAGYGAGLGGSRRDELIAAALADDLSPAERAEFDELRAADPGVDAELDSLGVVVGGLSTFGRWDDVAPSDRLRDRVAAIDAGGAFGVAGAAGGAGAAGDDADAADGADATVTRIGPHVAAARSGRGRRPLLIAVAAAACLAVGAGGGALLATPRDTVVDGPAGTLGATEHVDFTGQPAGVDLDGDLVAHTWGTETVLSVDGLPTGSAFTVVVVGDDGREYESGAFLGSDVRVDCRLNAAVLRPDVASVEIRAADGHDIAVASVPPVAS